MKKILVGLSLLALVVGSVFPYGEDYDGNGHDEEYIYGYNKASSGEENNCGDTFWGRSAYSCNQGYNNGISDRVNSENGNADKNTYNQKSSSSEEKQ